MADFTYTHLIYFEDMATTDKSARRIVNRFPSLVAARSMLSVLFDSRHDKNKTLLNDTVTITKNGEVMKRWTIAETSLEKDLKLR